MTKKKSKPMSTSLKRFLKKFGRFPKKGELKRINKRKGSAKAKDHKPKHHKKTSTKRSQKRSRGLIFG